MGEPWVDFGRNDGPGKRWQTGVVCWRFWRSREDMDQVELYFAEVSICGWLGGREEKSIAQDAIIVRRGGRA